MNIDRLLNPEGNGSQVSAVILPPQILPPSQAQSLPPMESESSEESESVMPSESSTTPEVGALSPLPQSKLSPCKPKKNRYPEQELGRRTPTGDVNFLPYEAKDNDEIRKHYDHFQVYPQTRFMECCQHVPYTSKKNPFQARTGRVAFEIFQYTFKVPGKDGTLVTHHVMWDYQIGLVRTSSFFKGCGFEKTAPGKLRNAKLNPGFEEISHSITGGVVAAQGYWMPFQCAKHIATRFAYKIRFALVPIFGPDFPESCLHADDPGYRNPEIPRAIIKAGLLQTKSWLQRKDAQLVQNSLSDEPLARPKKASRRKSSLASSRSTGLTPSAAIVQTDACASTFRILRPKNAVLRDGSSLLDTQSPLSEYTTSTDWTLATPSASPRTGWVAVNSGNSEGRLHIVRSASNQSAEALAVEGLIKLSSPKSDRLPASPLTTNPTANTLFPTADPIIGQIPRAVAPYEALAASRGPYLMHQTPPIEDISQREACHIVAQALVGSGTTARKRRRSEIEDEKILRPVGEGSTPEATDMDNDTGSWSATTFQAQHDGDGSSSSSSKQLGQVDMDAVSRLLELRGYDTSHLRCNSEHRDKRIKRTASLPDTSEHHN